MSDQRVTISLSSIISVLLMLLLLILLWQLQSLLVILMAAVVLAVAIAPIVNWAEQFHVPRWLTVVLVYLIALGGLAGFGWLIGPTVAQQTHLLIRQMSAYSDTAVAWVRDLAYRIDAEQGEQITQFINPPALVNWAIRSSQQVFLRSIGITRGIVGAVFSTVLVLLISGYMAAGSQPLIRGLVQLFPFPWNQHLFNQVRPVGRRMGGFIQGRILVSVVLGIVITVSLSLLGLSQFALALGVIAGGTNLIPFVGPLLGAIPALVIALSVGGVTWLWVLVLFVVVQNLESYVLDPLLVGSSVKIHPLYQLLAVFGGIQVLGVLGALIVPPWVAGAAVLVENLYLRPKRLAEAQSLSSAATDTFSEVERMEGNGGNGGAAMRDTAAINPD